MAEKIYLDKLIESARETGSIVCMGLDPVVEAWPERDYVGNERQIGCFLTYMDYLLDEMKQQKVFPGAFKPNHGFYIRYDKPLDEEFRGSQTLARTIREIRKKLPIIPIILDSKRGDIAASSENYAAEAFDCWNADAVTVSPYMGSDSVGPFIDRAMQDGRGVYILNRTSNKGARDLQDLMVDIPTNEGTIKQERLYEYVASKILEWKQDKPGVGAVIGAISLEELSFLTRHLTKRDIPLLIPGVGKQGGSAREVMNILRNCEYNLGLVRINSSSGLTHPWYKKNQNPKDMKEAAKISVAELAKLNNEIRYNAD